MDADFYDYAEVIETDISLLCRICANTSDDPLMEIYEENGVENDIATKIESYLPIKVSQEDILPVKICVNCANGILTFHQLYVNCLDADYRFKNMLAEEQLIVEGVSNEKNLLEVTDIDNNEQTHDTYLSDDDIKMSNEITENLDSVDDNSINAVSEIFEEQETKIVKTEQSTLNNRIVVRCQICNVLISDEAKNISVNIDFTDLNCETTCKNCKKEVSEQTINYTCEICEQQFLYRTDLRKHISKHNLITCKICNKVFKNYTNLSTHKRLHTGCVSYYNCLICDWRTNRKYNLQVHINSHVADNFCKICCASFNSQQNLEKHKSVHTKKELDCYALTEMKVACEKCHNEFESKLKLYQHSIKDHESMDKICECDCGRIFESETMLKNHQKTHKKNVFECKICCKTFSQLKNFVEHENAHFNLRPFKCDLCEKRFKYSSNLSQHKAMHKGIKNYVCIYCDRKFLRSNTFKVHLKTHRNERNYKCDLCDFSFIQHSSLTKHKRTIHRTCQLCGEMVGDRKQWQIHIFKECKISEATLTNKAIFD